MDPPPPYSVEPPPQIGFTVPYPSSPNPPYPMCPSPSTYSYNQSPSAPLIVVPTNAANCYVANPPNEHPSLFVYNETTVMPSSHLRKETSWSAICCIIIIFIVIVAFFIISQKRRPF